MNDKLKKKDLGWVFNLAFLVCDLCFVSELPWKNFSKKVEIWFKTCWGKSGWHNGTGLINVTWDMLLEYLKLHEMTDTNPYMYVNTGFH